MNTKKTWLDGGLWFPWGFFLMVDLVDFTIAAANPRLVSHSSAWVPHIPFAFTLIDLLRPRVFVELGTYKGDSYCAFCQAVDALKVPARCTAIDTWTGDPSTGFYGPRVLAGLRAYHEPRYGGFSTLLQSTFEAAASRFAAGSIDLLHIDGSHDYESVRRDFETWRERLSDFGVVLFHDTQVFAEGFGVHRLWRELAPRYPGFEFLHGYGLGVLAVGGNPPGRFAEFLKRANQSPESVRDLYAALGQRVEMGRGTAMRQIKTAMGRLWRWAGVGNSG